MNHVTPPIAHLVVVLLLGVAVTALAAPIAAAQAPTVLATAEEPTTTTVAPDPNAPQPAVEAPPATEEETEQPWTTRYLVPTFLLVGVLGLIVSLGYYGVRVRARYRVVR